MPYKPRTKVTTALLLIAACGLVPAAPALSAPVAAAPAAAASGWRVSYVHPEVAGHDTHLERIAVINRNDAWAAGATSQSGIGVGTLSRWNGKSWRNVRTPVKLSWSGPVAASSSRNVWAFARGQNADAGTYAMRWNGYGWKVKLLKGFHVGDAAVISPNDVWAIGFPREGTPDDAGTRAMHWNGRTWRKATIPDVPVAVSAVSSRDVWAVGDRAQADQAKYGKVSVLRLRNGRWQRVAIPRVDLPPGETNGIVEMRDIVALSARNVWAVGKIGWNPPDGDGPLRTLLLHWNGKKWSVQIGDGSPDEFFMHVAPDGAGGVWMTTSGGAYYHYTKGGKATRVPAPFPAVRRFAPFLYELANVPHTRSMIAVGQLQPVYAQGDETWDSMVQTLR